MEPHPVYKGKKCPMAQDRHDIYSGSFYGCSIYTGIAGDEEIEEGLLKVNRPSSRLVPGSRRGVQGHGGEGLFEEFVVLWLMLQTDLALVQIVVDVEVTEVGSGEQGIAATDKVATDF